MLMLSEQLHDNWLRGKDRHVNNDTSPPVHIDLNYALVPDEPQTPNILNLAICRIDNAIKLKIHNRDFPVRLRESRIPGGSHGIESFRAPLFRHSRH